MTPQNHVLAFVRPLIFSLLVFRAGLSDASPIEAPPTSFRPGAWGFSSQTDYFRTQANFLDSRMEYQRLSGDNSLSSVQSSFRARFHPTSQFGLFGGLTIARTQTLDPLNEKTNTGLGELYAGAYFPHLLKKLRLISEFEFSYPGSFGGFSAFETPFQRTPLLNDGSPFLRGLFHARQSFGRFRLLGYAGARLPLDGLATTGLYMAAAEYGFSSAFVLSAGINGFETLMKDQKTSTDRLVMNNTASAGSFRFRSFNPALTSLFANASYALSPTFKLKLGVEHTIAGVRTAQGQTVLLNLVYAFSPGVKKRRTRAEDRVTAPGNTPQFKIDSDGPDPKVIGPETDFEPTGKDDLNETERLLNEGESSNDTGN